MTASKSATVNHYRWDDMPAEPLKGGITRKLVTGERMMIAHGSSASPLPSLSQPSDRMRAAFHIDLELLAHEGGNHFTVGVKVRCRRTSRKRTDPS